MDKIASEPVSLPRDNPTQSYWQDPPDEIADLRTTASLPDSADVVIIGSGITGAAIAWNLLQNDADEKCPPRSIVMLEARQACSGATGRNGGHTKAASYRTYLHHAKEHGTDEAVKIAQLELDNIRAMHAFACEHAIDCDSHPCQTVDVIYDAAQWAEDQRAVQAMRDAMPGHPAAEYSLYTADEVRDKFYCGKGGHEDVAGGVGYEAGSMSSYRLVVGVLKMCMERGLNLQTNTPATSLEKIDGNDGDSWRVNTPRGTITAQKVILATNGYTAHLLPQFQGIIVPLRGHVTAQRPGQNMPTNGLPGTYSFVHGDAYDYMIPRPPGSRFAGDIIIGGGLHGLVDGGATEYGTTDDTGFDGVITENLRECLPDYFGDNWGKDHGEGRIRRAWTGIMGYGPDGCPFVGAVPDAENLWMAASFQGHGMVMCWMCAKALAAMVDGRDDDELKRWFPSAFRPNQDRLKQKFRGAVHMRPAES
ncbi:FAD dependent oxidoreductase [Apiospora arundinis]|uniref:FAD dependent oxidoreductase n=1 Tax=Apiospora arundinis TaxID=335852 RepID=A0ABR2I9G1_9PEZI